MGIEPSKQSGTSEFSPGAVIITDYACSACGYNLRTLEAAGRCPECGTPVKDSLLVLPNPSRTSSAIRLAAWASLVSLAAGCWGLFSVASGVMMFVAAYWLARQCGMEKMDILGQRAGWLYWASLASMVAAGLTLIPTGLNWAGAGGTGPVSGRIGSTVSTFARREASFAHPNLAGKIRVTDEGLGNVTVDLLDDDDQVTDTTTLWSGTSEDLKDVRGRTLSVTMDAAGKVMAKTQDGDEFTIAEWAAVTTAPGSSTLTTPLPRTSPLGIAFFSAVTAAFLALLDLAATVLYVLICRDIAARMRDSGLVRQFRSILVLLTISSIGGVVIAGGAAAAVLGRVPLLGGLGMPLLAVGGVLLSVAVICGLIGGIRLIVSSFRLARGLVSVPRQWTDVVGPAPVGATLTS